MSSDANSFPERIGQLEVFTGDSLIDQSIKRVRSRRIVGLQYQQFPAPGNDSWTAFKGFVG